MKTRYRVDRERRAVQSPSAFVRLRRDKQHKVQSRDRQKGAGRPRGVHRSVFGCVHLYSLMFGYVRICSLYGEKSATEAQSDWLSGRVFRVFRELSARTLVKGATGSKNFRFLTGMPVISAISAISSTYST